MKSTTLRQLGFWLLFAVPTAIGGAFVGCGSSSSGASDDSSATDSGTDTSIRSDASQDDGSPDIDATPAAPCATGATYLDDDGGVHPAPSPQVFGDKMSGCPGRVFWDDRATLCNSACTPCSAAQWVAMHGTTKPTYNYWTSDNLNYSGEYSLGLECFATTHAVQDGDAGIPYVSECFGVETLDDGGTTGHTSPMRVCYSDGIFDESSAVDPLGNECNWTRCALGLGDENLDAGPDGSFDPDAAPPDFDSMGGCDGNYTAGTLCCCP